MKPDTRSREREKRQELRKSLETEGYRVFVEPGTEDLPPALKELQPDIIALRDDENLVIEIKSRETLPHASQLTPIAEAVQRMEGWRFELVVTNSRDPREERHAFRSLTEEEIQHRLDEADRLTHQSSSEAAYLVTWVAVESALRRILEQLEMPLERETPAYAIKRLYSIAVLSRKDREVLERGLAVRNRLVHGYWTSANDLEGVRDLIALTKSLLTSSGGDSGP